MSAPVSIPIPSEWVDDAVEKAVAAECEKHRVSPDDPRLAPLIVRLRARLDSIRIVFPCCERPR